MLHDHVGSATIKRRFKIIAISSAWLFIYVVYRTNVTHIPMARYNNIDPVYVFSPALGLIGIVSDSAVGRRLAIVLLIIAAVCFSLAVLFFLRRR
jgi:hypothetical protein